MHPPPAWGPAWTQEWSDQYSRDTERNVRLATGPWLPCFPFLTVLVHPSSAPRIPQVPRARSATSTVAFHTQIPRAGEVHLAGELYVSLLLVAPCHTIYCGGVRSRLGMAQGPCPARQTGECTNPNPVFIQLLWNAFYLRRDLHQRGGLVAKRTFWSLAGELDSSAGPLCSQLFLQLPERQGEPETAVHSPLHLPVVSHTWGALQLGAIVHLVQRYFGRKRRQQKGSEIIASFSGYFYRLFLQ